MTQISAQPPAQALNALPIGASGVGTAGGETPGFSQILDGIGLPQAEPSPGLADIVISHAPAVLPLPGGNGGKASGKNLPDVGQASGDDLPPIEAPAGTALDPVGVAIALAAIGSSSHLPPSAAGLAPGLPTAASPPSSRSGNGLAATSLALPPAGAPESAPGGTIAAVPARAQLAVSPPVLGPITVIPAADRGPLIAVAEAAIPAPTEPEPRPASVLHDQGRLAGADGVAIIQPAQDPAPFAVTGVTAARSGPPVLDTFPAPFAAGGRGEAPHDFDTLVSHLVAAREAASPQVVRTSLLHAELGTIGLQFRNEAGGLSVTLVSREGDLEGSVQAALAAAPVPETSGRDARADQQPQRPPHQDAHSAFAAQQGGIAQSGGGQGGSMRDQADGRPATGRDRQATGDRGPASPGSEGMAAASAPAPAAERGGGIYA